MVGLWLACVAHAQQVIEVGGGGHATVAAALAVAADDDILRLHAGTYGGSHVVSVDLMVEPWGDGPVILRVDNTILGTEPTADGFFNASGASLTVRDVAIDGNGFRLARVTSGGALHLDRIDGYGGYRDTLGGALYAVHTGSSLTVTDSTIRQNAAGTAGGAIASDNVAVVTVSGTRFEGNVADAEGGALRCRGVCFLTDNVFVGNHALAGGAVWLDVTSGSVIERNRFLENTATTEGGGLRVGAPATVDYNVFFGNTAADGGGVWVGSAALTLRNNDFIGNVASGTGSALSAQQGAITLLNTIVVHDVLAPVEPLFSGNGNLTASHLLFWGNGALGNPDQTDNLQTGDPLFAGYLPLDPEGSDLSLTPPSPAVCAGDGIFDVHLGAFTDITEIPGDGYDSDCDGIELCFVDQDDDGVGDSATRDGSMLDCSGQNEAGVPGDCDDSDAQRYPGNVEVPVDGVDQDCDDLELCYADLDGDGFGTGTPEVPSDVLTCIAVDIALEGGDCDDADADVNPDAVEICNGIDDDCDNDVDANDPDLDECPPTTTATTTTTTTTTEPNPDDIDGDGFSPPADCDDEDPLVHPSASEVCNGRDDDCDGVIDGPSCDRVGSGVSDDGPDHVGCRCAAAFGGPHYLLVMLVPWLARRRPRIRPAAEG